MLGRQHRPLGIDKVREYAEIMEAESKRFYLRAARHSNDAAIRQLLGDLAAEERRHEARAGFFAEYPEIGARCTVVASATRS